MAVAVAWPAATAPIQPLDQELPYDTGAAIRKKKKIATALRTSLPSLYVPLPVCGAQTMSV